MCPVSAALAGEFFTTSTTFRTSLVAQTVKNLPAMQDTQVQSLGWEDTLEKEMATHSSFLPGKFHEQRSPVGYSPQDHIESNGI